LLAFTLTYFAAFKSDVITSKDVEILKSSVRVDVVGMPKYTLQELKKMTMEDFQQQEPTFKEEPKEEVGGSEKVVFKKETKKINVNNLLAGFSNRKINAPKVKKKKINLNQSQLKKLVLEGNKVATGNALVGDGEGEVDMGAFSQYANNLPNVIRPYWKLPSYLLQQNLKCRIRVFISESGKITKTQIYESSGNPEYDQKAMDAIMKVGTFPKPKNEFVKLVANGSIILGFPL
jgi:colicin import membrane protein